MRRSESRSLGNIFFRLGSKGELIGGGGVRICRYQVQKRKESQICGTTPKGEQGKQRIDRGASCKDYEEGGSTVLNEERPFSYTSTEGRKETGKQKTKKKEKKIDFECGHDKGGGGD